MTRDALLPIESLRVHLGALVADCAEKLGVERRADEAGSHDDLRQILMKRGYPQQAAVFEFEERYGGVLVPDYDREDWYDESDFSLVGPWACLNRPWERRGGPGQVSLGLVPVIYTSQDNVYFLDKMGGGWGQDLISGNDAFRTAMNGDELFASFILYAGLNRDPNRRHQLEGAHGAEIGRRLGAAPIAVASRVDRWWGSPDVLILETTTKASWFLDPAEVNAAPRNTFVAVLSSASDAALNTIK